MNLTLDELKEQNAKEEADRLAAAELLENPQVVDPKVGDDDLVILDDDGNPVVTVEPWMQEEEAGEQTSDDPSKNVPVGKFVSLKKELRGKIEDRDKELEKLRSENEALRLASPQKNDALTRPDRNDFGSDEEHALALSKYDGQLSQETYNRNRKTEQQAEHQRQAQETVNQAMDAHYEQADELMKTSGIAREKYIAASNNTKAVFNDLFGKDGNAVFENVFAKLGKGSEKLEYFIGVNRAAQDKIKSLIKADPLGIGLAMWLGQEKQRLSKPIKPRTNAPDPASSLKGDVNADTGGTVSAKKLKKVYDDAGAGTQTAYNAKKKAKAAGVDVSRW